MTTPWTSRTAMETWNRFNRPAVTLAEADGFQEKEE